MQSRVRVHRLQSCGGGRSAPLPALPWRPRGGERTAAARVGLSSRDDKGIKASGQLFSLQGHTGCDPVRVDEASTSQQRPSDKRGTTGAVRRFVKSRIARKVRAGRRLSRDGVGLLLAALIFGAWVATLPLLFAQPERLMPRVLPSWAPPGASTLVIMAARTWLTTGLFVTVHDAIHGQVAPSFKRVNHSLGALCAFCYASFSYNSLYRDHWRHHASPLSHDDPDWYQGGLARWLGSFLGHYSTFWQLFWESFQFWSFVAIGQRLVGIDFSWMVVRVTLIWALPALISGMQLFYFGTYLPHRDSPESAHSARSNDWPYWLSLLSCFHFGACHEEHHAFPQLAWWELPQAKARGLARNAKPATGGQAKD